MRTTTKINARVGREKYTTELTTREHKWLADEPGSNGGRDVGPTSKELIASSLAACIAITLRMYADRKGWDVEGIEVDVAVQSIQIGEGKMTRFDAEIEISGQLTEKEKDRMRVIAGKCPIHKLLTHPIEINTVLRP